MTVPAWAAGVCAGIHAAGSRDVVYVPDNPMSHVLRALEDQFHDIRRVLATREEEAFGIAAGLYLGGRLPTVMLQSSGLGNSLNAVTSLLLPYEIPVLVVVSMRGDAGEWNAAQMPMGRAVRSIFDAIGVPHWTVESADAARETVRLAGTTAFGTHKMGACLLPRRLTVSGTDSGTNSGTDSGTGVR
jgi:sulfopyruvate decarboxylase subunit alpha